MTMTWTLQQRLEALLRLPWTVTTAKSEFGDYHTASVAELPELVATGETERDLAKDVYAALRANLNCRLKNGDEIPLPPGASYPWADGASPRSKAVRFKLYPQADAWRFGNTGAFATIPASPVASQ